MPHVASAAQKQQRCRDGPGDCDRLHGFADLSSITDLSCSYAPSTLTCSAISSMRRARARIANSPAGQTRAPSSGVVIGSIRRLVGCETTLICRPVTVLRTTCRRHSVSQRSDLREKQDHEGNESGVRGDEVGWDRSRGGRALRLAHGATSLGPLMSTSSAHGRGGIVASVRCAVAGPCGILSICAATPALPSARS